MNSRSHSILTHLLVGKSIIEALLVGAIAVGFFVMAFPPFQGSVEVTPQSIAGWVIDPQHKTGLVKVQLFIDDHFVATDLANLKRPDIVSAGVAVDDAHGFNFAIPSLGPGEHVARVYAEHSSQNDSRKTLQMIGRPIDFVVDVEGISHQRNSN